MYKQISRQKRHCGKNKEVTNSVKESPRSFKLLKYELQDNGNKENGYVNIRQ